MSSPLGERDLSCSDSDSDSDSNSDRDGDDDDEEDSDAQVGISAAPTGSMQVKQQHQVLSCVAPDMGDGDSNNGGARAILQVEDYHPRSEAERCAHSTKSMPAIQIYHALLFLRMPDTGAINALAE